MQAICLLAFICKNYFFTSTSNAIKLWLCHSLVRSEKAVDRLTEEQTVQECDATNVENRYAVGLTKKPPQCDGFLNNK